MTIVGLDYGHAGQMHDKDIVGGAPYGATTIAGPDGSRRPSEIDLTVRAIRAGASPKSQQNCSASSLLNDPLCALLTRV